MSQREPFVGVHELTVRANLREPVQLSKLVWALLGMFMLAIGLWAIALAMGR